MRTLHAAAIAAALSFAAVLPAPAAAQAQEAAAASATASRDGVTMPREVTVGGRKLVLNGLGLRKKFVVKVYVAGLYLPQRSSDAEAILAADEPRHMVLDFLHGVSNDQMCGAFQDGLKDNTPDASDALKAQFDQACGMMPEKLEKRDQLAFTYVPGTGTTISVKGEAKGTIPGKEFADALFKAWLGPKPGPGNGTKKDLLGARL